MVYHYGDFLCIFRCGILLVRHYGRLRRCPERLKYNNGNCRIVNYLVCHWLWVALNGFCCAQLFTRKENHICIDFVAVIFIIPCAVARNIETLLVCRLIDGIAFSAPMPLVGGSLADLWRTGERGIPMAAFSAAPLVLLLVHSSVVL